MQQFRRKDFVQAISHRFNMRMIWMDDDDDDDGLYGAKSQQAAITKILMHLKVIILSH